MQVLSDTEIIHQAYMNNLIAIFGNFHSAAIPLHGDDPDYTQAEKILRFGLSLLRESRDRALKIINEK